MTCAVLQISTTNICNAKCSFCFRSKLTRPLGVMAEALFDKLIEENPAQAINLCTFGEPLCDPMLIDRVAVARLVQRKAFIYFHTNGSLLTPEKVLQLKDAGLSHLYVSIYGSTPEQHTRLQPPLRFDHVVKNATFATKHLPVTIVCNLVEPMDLPRITAFWRERGCSVAVDTGLIYGEGASAAEQLLTVSSRCAMLVDFRLFDWNGDMMTCCFDFNGLNVFGNGARESWGRAEKRLRHAPCAFCAGCKFKPRFDYWRRSLT